MRHFHFILLMVLPVTVIFAAKPASDTKLWYTEPASVFEEALPLGNGRLGAMVYGKTDREIISLNESSLWSGGPVNPNPNADASFYLSEIRELINKGEYAQATELSKKMQGAWTSSYMPLGNIIIEHLNKGVTSDCKRELDLNTAIATSSFTSGGTKYLREVFTSFNDDVIIIRLSTDKKKKLDVKLSLSSQLQSLSQKISGNEIEMTGKSPSIVEPSYVEYAKTPVIYSKGAVGKGTKFSLRMKLSSTDGEVSINNNEITIEKASEAIIILSIATSFNGFDKKPDIEGLDPSLESRKYFTTSLSKKFEQIKNDHIAKYKNYFSRVILDIQGETHNNLPTNIRLKNYSKGGRDIGLEVLYFNFGRYLLISSSRPDGFPANLQGIWNASIRPPWSSNYTLNINVQMNYWFAENCNLSELHKPLFSLIKNLSVTGVETAKNYYNAKGWCAHHNSDIWATSNPVGDFGRLGDAKWANWSMGGVWLCQHLWQHYLFTQDINFLRNTAYPLLKGAALFCNDWLIPSADGKYLITSPSVSPENVFITKQGFAEVSMASTMDMTLIRELFSNVVEAGKILRIDPDFTKELQQKLPQLYPFKIGRNGDLQEWFSDFEAKDPKHRHLSHLYALYPGNDISISATPQLAEAAKVSLDLHGDEGAGWSKAWKINLRARLHDGEKAYSLLRELLHYSSDFNSGSASSPEAASIGSGGTYPNLFCAGPPFQIDGNFGGTAGIVEMLLQSQHDEIHILPAIPNAWGSGSYSGLKARNAFEVSVSWKNHNAQLVKIKSIVGNKCTLRSSNKLFFKDTNQFSMPSGKEFLLVFETQPGKEYTIISK